MKKKILIVLIIILAAIGAGYYFCGRKNNSVAPQPISEANYLCNDKKSIETSYFGETRKLGSVKIILSDGREMTLSQTISADGGRYANSDESFIFWGKGNGAFVLENNNQTYSGCIVVAPNPGDLPQVYESDQNGFSIRYPQSYTADANYKYQELGPGKDIAGIKFIIPKSLATGTNLSGFDTGVSVEEIPNTENCSAGLFLYPGAKTENITDNNIQYSFASTTGAGAGNFYEEDVWALPDSNPCLAIRYFIHSTNIGNYPPGAVKEFDRNALLNQFDEIRRSLILR